MGECRADGRYDNGEIGMIKAYRWDELKVGMEESFSVEIDQGKMDCFMDITSDVNPMHLDESYARRRGVQGKLVYGMLTASMISRLSGCYLPGKFSVIQSVEINFAKPVIVGDSITVIGKLIELNDTVKQAVVRIEIYNQKGEKVLRGKLKAGVQNED